VILLVASISAGVLVTALSVVTHADPLGPNQILVLVVAALYGWVIRKLVAGSRAAYRRVRFVSAAGFLLVAGQLVAGGHPAWLRAAEGVQLALLAALIGAVNRRVVRAAFPAVPDERPRNRRAALVLALLAPLCAEVSLGTVPLRMAWAWLVFAPIYAAGALFLREVLRRTGGGYSNLLLLGVAYGLFEEGLVLQSLTSPHLYGAAGWGPRFLGVNTAYTELNLVYHALFSVTVPVILVEFLFPRHGTTPYLRRGGVIDAGRRVGPRSRCPPWPSPRPPMRLMTTAPRWDSPPASCTPSPASTTWPRCCPSACGARSRRPAAACWPRPSPSRACCSPAR